MSWVERAGAIAAAFGLHRLSDPTGPLIVMYHGIGGRDGVRPDELAKQLDALVERRRVVSLRDAVAALGSPAARDLAAITFDDGYRDFGDIAVPLLAARGLHSTVFVPAALIGQWNRWDARRMERREIMNASQLRDLDPTRIDVGAHGMTHRPMRALTEADLAFETSAARSRLEDILGRPVDLFAYPYGQRDDFDPRAERAVAAARFIAAATTCFGRSSSPAQRYRLRRLGIDATHALIHVQHRLDGALDWLAPKEAVAYRFRSLIDPRAEKASG